MVKIEDLAGRTPFEPVAGILMRAGWGETVMVNQLEMAPDTEIPAHSHPHEQAGLILEGELLLAFDGETHRLGPGMLYTVSGGVVHAGRAGAEGCRLIDVFAPVREDYRDAQVAAACSTHGAEV